MAEIPAANINPKARMSMLPILRTTGDRHRAHAYGIIESRSLRSLRRIPLVVRMPTAQGNWGREQLANEQGIGGLGSLS